MGKAGRPPTFQSAEAMQQVIDDYFKSCDGKPILNTNGEPIFDKAGNVILIGAHPPTVTGLALALGFHSRQSLLNYQGKKAFMDTVTRAKMQIEAYAEERLYDRDGQRGAEFNLKYNFRWAEQNKGDDEDEGTGVVELPAIMDSPGPPGSEGGNEQQ
jgi:hypothetical protein